MLSQRLLGIDELLQYFTVDQAVYGFLADTQRRRTQLLYITNHHAIESAACHRGSFAISLDADVTTKRIDAFVDRSHTARAAASLKHEFRIRWNEPLEIVVDAIIVVEQRHGISTRSRAEALADGRELIPIRNCSQCLLIPQGILFAGP